MLRNSAVCAAVVVLAAGSFACSQEKVTPETAEPIATEAGGEQDLHLLRDPVAVGDFTVTTLDGKTISVKDLRGKVVLVNFWATWCPPCRAEIPDLVKLQDQYRDSLVVIGMSEDEDTADKVKAFATEQKINYPIAMTTPEVRKIFTDVSALPTTYVIDRDGKIQQRHVGMLDPATTELEAQVLSGIKTNVRIERVDDPKDVLLRNAAQAKEIPGVDLSKMTPEQRTAALKALNAENCTCGCGLTLAACRINDPQCEISLPIAKALAEKVAKAQTH